jgi:hypothetical protein
MTPQDFRAALRRLGLSQVGLARRLETLGDDRPYPTRLRCIQELASLGRTTPIPWSVVAMMTLLEAA